MHSVRLIHRLQPSWAVGRSSLPVVVWSWLRVAGISAAALPRQPPR